VRRPYDEKLSVLSLIVVGVLPLVMRGDEPETRREKLMSSLEAPPTYVRNAGDESKWPRLIRQGVDAARKYFGNYGPVYIYILGHADDALDTDEFLADLVDQYCRNRSDDDERDDESCRKRFLTEFGKKVRRDRGDAYLSYVDRTDPPIAELVFINPHEFRDPYLCTRGIHEYTHVVQRAFPSTPTWMKEGGAEFFAAYLGEKHGWERFQRAMTEFMKNVHRVEDPSLGIADMEDVDKVSPEVKKYYRHLAYDSGAWAFAFMIYKSDGRSIAGTKKVFYPLVAKHGWERALAIFARVKDKAAFYREFAAFLKKPLEAQRKMLEELED